MNNWHKHCQADSFLDGGAPHSLTVVAVRSCGTESNLSSLTDETLGAQSGTND